MKRLGGLHIDRGAGCWVLGAGCWVLGAGCWVLELYLRLSFKGKVELPLFSRVVNTSVYLILLSNLYNYLPPPSHNVAVKKDTKLVNKSVY